MHQAAYEHAIHDQKEAGPPSHLITQIIVILKGMFDFLQIVSEKFRSLFQKLMRYFKFKPIISFTHFIILSSLSAMVHVFNLLRSCPNNIAKTKIINTTESVDFQIVP